jgi:hypothetical protein
MAKRFRADPAARRAPAEVARAIDDLRAGTTTAELVHIGARDFAEAFAHAPNGPLAAAVNAIGDPQVYLDAVRRDGELAIPTGRYLNEVAMVGEGDKPLSGGSEKILKSTVESPRLDPGIREGSEDVGVNWNNASIAAPRGLDGREKWHYDNNERNYPEGKAFLGIDDVSTAEISEARARYRSILIGFEHTPSVEIDAFPPEVYEIAGGVTMATGREVMPYIKEGKMFLLIGTEDSRPN